MGVLDFNVARGCLVVGVFLQQIEARGFEGIPGNYCRKTGGHRQRGFRSDENDNNYESNEGDENDATFSRTLSPVDRIKPSECCEDRFDDCAVPILGTMCYCDEFCLSGDAKHDDCCPDFAEVCLGAQPGGRIPLPPAELGDDPEVQLKACEVGGSEIPFGGSKSFNCNEW
ncbi:hypothetical protein C7M84_007114 [Penaeus vannamei]|uniref:SMB domain-containing protein n=1 Tax=Penaeus vannamei TaxID=6689 RepID=A0A3R7STI2_PENVA|nr:hypothetical protein C7M84_007114 [Penaeus vannamei]